MTQPSNQNSNNLPTNDETEIRNKAIHNLLVKSTIPFLEALGKQAYAKPSCFVCYAWDVPKLVKLIQTELAPHLKLAGVNVALDIWHNTPGTWIVDHTQRIGPSDVTVVCCSEKMRQKSDDPKSKSVVKFELKQVFTKLKNEEDKQIVLPILLDGTQESAIPPFLQGMVHIDFTNKLQYTTQLLELLKYIYAIKDPQAVAVIEKFQKDHKSLLDLINKGKMEDALQPLIEAEKRSMQEKKEAKKQNALNQLYNPASLMSAYGFNSTAYQTGGATDNNNNNNTSPSTTAPGQSASAEKKT